ncbi:MAG TPA: hypothetical protein VI911_11670 [Patescibacteria group bacterium]|nr:hypothetical protein [Patescibacteria group bacterium]
MKYVLLIIFIVATYNTGADEQTDENNRANFMRAKGYVQKAILKSNHIYKVRKKAEYYVMKKTGLKKSTVFIITTTVASLYKGEIGTKPIRKLTFKFVGGHVRPDFVHNFKKQETMVSVSIKWEF